MGKNRDVKNIGNIVGTAILHEILAEHTNRPESVNHLMKESVEYRGQSIKKINKVNLNDEDKKQINKIVINKIKNRLKNKYPDVQVSQEEIFQKVERELLYFFN